MNLLTFQIFKLFVKYSVISFGGVFGVLPQMENEIVQHHHWMTHDQFIQTFVLSQFVPGPNMAMCPMIGYQLNGWPGFIAGFFGIYLLPAAIIALAFSVYRRYRNLTAVRKLEISMRPTVIGLITASSIHLWMEQSKSLVPNLAGSMVFSALLTLAGLWATQRQKITPFRTLIVFGMITAGTHLLFY